MGLFHQAFPVFSVVSTLKLLFCNTTVTCKKMSCDSKYCQSTNFVKGWEGIKLLFANISLKSVIMLTKEKCQQKKRKRCEENTLPKQWTNLYCAHRTIRSKKMFVCRYMSICHSHHLWYSYYYIFLLFSTAFRRHKC